MRPAHAIPPPANHDPASPQPQSDRYKLIICCCIAFAGLAVLGLLMVIFLAIPTGTPLGLGLNLGSSPWSLNISVSYSKLVTVVEYHPIKLLLSFDGQLALSRASPVSPFTQGPGWATSVQAKAQSTLRIVTDLGVNGLVSTLSGGEVTIDVAARVEWRLQLGPWCVAEFDVDVSFTGLHFTAPSDSRDHGGWMILGGTLGCSLDIIPRLWEAKLLVPT